MSITRLTAFLALSALITYGVEFYSFTLAHSSAGLLAVLVCPGILVVVTNLLLGIWGWTVAILLNVLYFEFVWRLAARIRKESIPRNEN